MQPLRQMRLKPASYAAIPLHVALGLCLVAFLAGRCLSRSPHLFTTEVLFDNQEPQGWAEHCLQQSGIQQHRPPLQPAASGNTHYTLAPYQVLSWYPRIVLFPNFIDAARADAIIRLAQGHLQPSTVTVVESDGGQHIAESAGRSSSGTFLASDKDTSGALEWLEKRIQDVTLLPASHGENFYVIKYQAGEQYSAHLDPHDDKQTSKRVATVVVYLNDVESGGETLFPREGREGADRRVGGLSCSQPEGLRYKPRKGDALLFYSQHPDLTLDPRSVHAGCAVGTGSEKWVATKWIRNKPVVPEGGFGWADN